MDEQQVPVAHGAVAHHRDHPARFPGPPSAGPPRPPRAARPSSASGAIGSGESMAHRPGSAGSRSGVGSPNRRAGVEVEAIDGGEDLTPAGVDHRGHRPSAVPRPAGPADAAGPTRRRCGQDVEAADTPRTPSPRAWARALAVATPTRSPVNRPGSDVDGDGVDVRDRAARDGAYLLDGRGEQLGVGPPSLVHPLGRRRRRRGAAPPRRCRWPTRWPAVSWPPSTMVRARVAQRRPSGRPDVVRPLDGDQPALLVVVTGRQMDAAAIPGPGRAGRVPPLDQRHPSVLHQLAETEVDDLGRWSSR